MLKSFDDNNALQLKHHVSINQGFPNWGTCTPRGTFAYLKGYI